MSTQKMVAKLDAGDVLVVEKTPIFQDDTSQTLHDRLAMLGAKALAKTIEGLVAGTLKGTPQEDSGVTVATKLTKEMERIDCSKSVLEIDRQVRAFTPWPGTSVMLDGTSERLKIRRVMPRSEVSNRPGVLFGAGGRLFLGASDGCLEVLEVQPDGKRSQSAAEFLSGRVAQKKPLEWKI
ncbi:hypothetical protein EBZ37_12805 [bacterium]|nr:hypothetical protein [bacterium]